MHNNICLFIGFLMLSFINCKGDDPDELSSTASSESSTAVTSAASSSLITVTTESELKEAIGNAAAGDSISVSGTIYLTSILQCLNSGTSESKITFTGDTLDCSNISSGWGVKVNGSYWNITNLTIKNAPDCGLVLQKGGYNYVYKVTTHGNGDSGLQIYNEAHDNTISYCTSYGNYDEATGGENADGFACKLSAGENNVFEYCLARENSDDGWDLYGQPYTVIITHCTAEKNGYGTDGDGNGFKLGSSGQNVDHTVTYCTSNDNLGAGYDGNGNTGHITTTGSTGSGNGKELWYRIY